MFDDHIYGDGNPMMMLQDSTNDSLRFVKFVGLRLLTSTATSYAGSFIFALEQGKEQEVCLKDLCCNYALGIVNTDILIRFS